MTVRRSRISLGVRFILLLGVKVVQNRGPIISYGSAPFDFGKIFIKFDLALADFNSLGQFLLRQKLAWDLSGCYFVTAVYFVFVGHGRTLEKNSPFALGHDVE